MNDELDQLTDAQLSEVFAVEVAGWKKTTGDFTEPLYVHPDGSQEFRAGLPRYAMSADAVLPFLERCRAWSKGTVGTAVAVYADRLSPAPKPDGVPDSEWMILHVIGHHWNEASPPVPFARAACIALIRAKRAQSK